MFDSYKTPTDTEPHQINIVMRKRALQHNGSTKENQILIKISDSGLFWKTEVILEIVINTSIQIADFIISIKTQRTTSDWDNEPNTTYFGV